MSKGLLSEIDEVISHFPGLLLTQTGSMSTLRGVLSFSASFENLETITGSFNINILIPPDYPNSLPVVSPESAPLDSSFEHINPDGSFCLAVPIEARKLFNSEPSLLGFVDNLVVPFFYGYCYFLKHGIFPFGEQAHGNEGILEYYSDLYNSKDIKQIIFSLHEFLNAGYKPHAKCPCGSDKKVLKCHKAQTKLLLSNEYKSLLLKDLQIFIQN